MDYVNLLVVLISVLTFGLITPTQLITNVNAENPSERDTVEGARLGSYGQETNYFNEAEVDKEKFIEDLVKQAEHAVLSKIRYKD